MVKENIQLPESFHKSRKSYVFASFALLAWEFIGLSLENLSNDNVNMSVESPEAVPIFILLAVIYLSIRSIIEWNLISDDLRSNVYVKREYYITHTFAMISVGVYVFQLVSGTQVFEYFESTLISILVTIPSFMIGIFFIKSFDLIIGSRIDERFGNKISWIFYSIILVGSYLIFQYHGFNFSFNSNLDYVIVGFYISILVYIVHPIIPDKYVLKFLRRDY